LDHAASFQGSVGLARWHDPGSPHQEWIIADMRRVSLDRRFDGILAWDNFFHLDHDDQRRMCSQRTAWPDDSRAGRRERSATLPPSWVTRRISRAKFPFQLVQAEQPWELSP
jgi:hypothetical protein